MVVVLREGEGKGERTYIGESRGVFVLFRKQKLWIPHELESKAVVRHLM